VPRFNVTNATTLLSCIGSLIDQSDQPSTDFLIGSIRDQTKPLEVPGLLATDNTMMTSIALDRMQTKKVNVVGPQGVNKQGRVIQLVGAFTELNRTLSSNALGVSGRISDYELEFGTDDEWNHIAFDMALTQNGRVINGMTTSVSIIVAGNSGDGNVNVQPNNDSSAVISFGYRNKEGIHSAQRLLIETSAAVLIARLYNVDSTECFKKAYKEDAIIHQPNIQSYFAQPHKTKKSLNDSKFSERQEAETPSSMRYADEVSVSDKPNSLSEGGQKMSEVQNSVRSQSCKVIEPGMEDGMPSNWQYQWLGPCSEDGYAEGEGQAVVSIDGKVYLKYYGNMSRGYREGQGRMVFSNGEYVGQFIDGNPTDKGVILKDGRRYGATFDRTTRKLIKGNLSK
jgi:hypothetical protein